ncbi:MAG TPA: pseudouridine synthase [Thermoanaerobaculia bacterium]|nr:pseudouridine synthase [Thermoanaerobaculia bacterium]
MSEERLQKILARAGIASRRKAEELIREGSVTVNGQVAGIGDKADPERDAIKVEGKRIHLSHEHKYLLLNKPKGVMSTLSDPEERPTIIDFIPPALRKALVPVGRLDFNTEGLLLLTDDGDFAQRIAHPRYGSTKTYEVKVKGRPTEAQIERLRTGILLEGKRTAPAKITSRTPFKPEGARRRGEPESDNSWWIVELTEGRTRQIREMFFHIGHPVQKLRRVAIGPLRDPHLPVGALRELTEQEVQKLLKSARGLQEKTAEKPAAAKRPAAAKKPAAGKKPAAAKKAAPGEKPAKRTAAKKATGKPARKAPAKRTTLKEFAKRSPAKGPGGRRTGVKRGRG